MKKELQECFLPISCSDRLPNDSDGYHIQWRTQGDSTILGAAVFAFYNANEFDVSDDDDENPAQPRGAQPTHWLEKQQAIILTKEEWDALRDLEHLYESEVNANKILTRRTDLQIKEIERIKLLLRDMLDGMIAGKYKDEETDAVTEWQKYKAEHNL